MPAEEHAHHGYKRMGEGWFSFLFLVVGRSVESCMDPRGFSWEEGEDKAMNQVQHCSRGYRGSVAVFNASGSAS